jgi:hypothetical protein
MNSWNKHAMLGANKFICSRAIREHKRIRPQFHFYMKEEGTEIHQPVPLSEWQISTWL